MLISLTPPPRWLQLYIFFFFNDTATTEIYTLSLHDALPISQVRARARCNKKSTSSPKGHHMKRVLSFILLAAGFFAAPPFAPNPRGGVRALGLAKSKFGVKARTVGPRGRHAPTPPHTLGPQATAARGG